jgi:CubicO group peptidase (beta-lactamase class C family)
LQSPSRGKFLGGIAAAAAAAACSPHSQAVVPQSAGEAISPDKAGAKLAAIRAVIDGYISSNKHKRHLGIVVGIVSEHLPKTRLLFGGKLVAAQNHHLEMIFDGSTPFEIGSITKTFTSWVFGTRRHDYGGVLGDYLKISLPSGIKDMSVDSIVSYSAGFPTDDEPPIWYDDFINANGLRNLIKTLAGKNLPQCAGGKAYSYSNFAWGLLGLAAVGADAGRADVDAKWAASIAQLGDHIGLSNTTAPATPNVAAILPAGYNVDGQPLPESTSYYETRWSTLFGGGDLVSTGDDMYRWLRYNMGYGPLDSLLRRQQTPSWSWAMEQPPAKPGTLACLDHKPLVHPISTAVGWFRPSWGTSGSVRGLAKNGGVEGFTSWMGFVEWMGTGKPSRNGAFVLTNYGGAATALGQSIIKILVG